MGYISWSTFAVRVMDKETGQEVIVLILKRHGISWQLPSIRLPLVAKGNLEETTPSAIATTPSEVTMLTLRDVAWSKSRYGVLFANCSISNPSATDVRDLNISFRTYGQSGTTLGSVTKTIYEVVKAKSVKDYEGIEFGPFDPQTATVHCQATAKDN